jgi:hypothetical protein
MLGDNHEIRKPTGDCCTPSECWTESSHVFGASDGLALPVLGHQHCEIAADVGMRRL